MRCAPRRRRPYAARQTGKSCERVNNFSRAILACMRVLEGRFEAVDEKVCAKFAGVSWMDTVGKGYSLVILNEPNIKLRTCHMDVVILALLSSNLFCFSWHESVASPSHGFG